MPRPGVPGRRRSPLAASAAGRPVHSRSTGVGVRPAQGRGWSPVPAQRPAPRAVDAWGCAARPRHRPPVAWPHPWWPARRVALGAAACCRPWSGGARKQEQPGLAAPPPAAACPCSTVCISCRTRRDRGRCDPPWAHVRIGVAGTDPRRGHQIGEPGRMLGRNALHPARFLERPPRVGAPLTLLLEHHIVAVQARQVLGVAVDHVGKGRQQVLGIGRLRIQRVQEGTGHGIAGVESQVDVGDRVCAAAQRRRQW